MSGLEYNMGRHTGIQRLLPAVDAETPAVARLEPGEIPLGGRRTQVVAALLRKLQEFRRHFGADDVDAPVFGAGLAAACAIEAGVRLELTDLQCAAQHVGFGRGRLVGHVRLRIW